MEISLKSLLKTPKIQMGLFLFLIAVSAIVHSQSYLSLFSVFLALLATLAADFIFVKIRKIESFFPSAAIVTGLIIGLLTFFGLPWYEIVITGIVAMTGKNFIRINNQHVFNPAGFGLFVTSLIFHQTVSWWGVSFQNFSLSIVPVLYFLILISPGFVSMIRMKRYFISLSFLSLYIIYDSFVQLLHHNFHAFTIMQVILLSSTILFFSIVMLPEPMTSPNNHKMQMFYGSFVAVLAIILSLLSPSYLPDAFIAAILIGNAVFFAFR